MNDKILMSDNGLVNFTNAIAIEEVVTIKMYDEATETQYATEFVKNYPYKLKGNEIINKYEIVFQFSDNKPIIADFDTEEQMLSSYEKIKRVYENNQYNIIVHDENLN